MFRDMQRDLPRPCSKGKIRNTDSIHLFHIRHFANHRAYHRRRDTHAYDVEVDLPPQCPRRGSRSSHHSVCATARLSVP